MPLSSAAPSRKRLSGGGRSRAGDPSAPDGAGGSGVRRAASRAKASNSSGAAAVRPVSPGVAAPSGRPTHTAIVWRPSKPTDQASRKP